MPSRITATDWLGYRRFRVGTFVLEKGDRLDHAAEITAIHPNLTATVVYVISGFRGELPLADLELVEEHIDADD